MDVKFSVATSGYMAKSILESYQEDNKFMNLFLKNHRDFNSDAFLSLRDKDKYKYLKNWCDKKLKTNNFTIQYKLRNLQETWSYLTKYPLNRAVGNLFNEPNINDLFNKCEGFITLNPIIPASRYIKYSTFDVYIGVDINTMIFRAIHELIHFIWFYKWTEYFGSDNEDEYEIKESLIYTFSEISMEILFRDIHINKIVNRLCVKENPAYDYFYQLDGKPINVLSHIYLESNDMREYMTEGFKYWCEYYSKKVHNY